ncbi:MAG: acyl-CoA dehydrogenase, partial [Thermaurantiacus tibetensis]
ISLFVVPKFLPNADGSLGARNPVSCGKIEEKVGIHGNATCVMNYDGATGFLIGEEMKGLKAMFVMMNVARLGVGLQGLAQAEVACQNAAAYAKERLQGRALSGPKNPDGKADPILVHPDVRRMLLDARAFTEGGRALCLWAALQADLARHAETPAEREQAEDLLSLLTPVIKAYLTDKGYHHATMAQQVFGGHGYIAEWGMEQFVRDARIAMIYEGTNGIQALDLVGRKLAANGGRALRSFLALVDAEIEEAKRHDALAPFAGELAAAKADLEGATLWLMEKAFANPDHAGAGATAYLELVALVTFGMLWLKLLRAADAAEAEGEDPAFCTAKRLVGRHFFERHLVDAPALVRKVKAGADTLMAMPEAAF